MNNMMSISSSRMSLLILQLVIIIVSLLLSSSSSSSSSSMDKPTGLLHTTRTKLQNYHHHTSRIDCSNVRPSNTIYHSKSYSCISRKCSIAFVSFSSRQHDHRRQHTNILSYIRTKLNSSSNNNDKENNSNNSNKNEWNGEVVSNSKDGRIRGCTIRPASSSISSSDDKTGTVLLNQILSKNNNIINNNDSSDSIVSNTDWVIQIDGIEADLGRFSFAIYKKLIQDAKQQRYQGYRANTIPPPLLKTYRIYAMDECARETILEVLEQNNIRPFENCRTEMMISNITIPVIQSKSNTNNKSKGNKKKKIKTNDTNDSNVNNDNQQIEQQSEQQSSSPQWVTYTTIQEAIDIGRWEPGQSFSFIANKVYGQSIKNGIPYGTTSIGVNY